MAEMARRDGLKIHWALIPVWVRIPLSVQVKNKWSRSPIGRGNSFKNYTGISSNLIGTTNIVP